jgi:hypothetical protein
MWPTMFSPRTRSGGQALPTGGRANHGYLRLLLKEEMFYMLGRNAMRMPGFATDNFQSQRAKPAQLLKI